jgi:hypothetical protein
MKVTEIFKEDIRGDNILYISGVQVSELFEDLEDFFLEIQCRPIKDKKKYRMTIQFSHDNPDRDETEREGPIIDF